MCPHPHLAGHLWMSSAGTSRKMPTTGHQGALRALNTGRSRTLPHVAPHAPNRTSSGDRASTRPRRRRTSGLGAPRAGEDRDTLLRIVAPGWCLSLTGTRTTRARLAALLTTVALSAFGSCTGTVQRHPDAPAPQTPTSSRDPGSDEGRMYVPSEPPSATVRFYDMHTPTRVPARCSKPVGSCD